MTEGATDDDPLTEPIPIYARMFKVQNAAIEPVIRAKMKVTEINILHPVSSTFKPSARTLLGAARERVRKRIYS